MPKEVVKEAFELENEEISEKDQNKRGILFHQVHQQIQQRADRQE